MKKRKTHKCVVSMFVEGNALCSCTTSSAPANLNAATLVSAAAAAAATAAALSVRASCQEMPKTKACQTGKLERERARVSFATCHSPLPMSLCVCARACAVSCGPRTVLGHFACRPVLVYTGSKIACLPFLSKQQIHRRAHDAREERDMCGHGLAGSANISVLHAVAGAIPANFLCDAAADQMT